MRPRELDIGAIEPLTLGRFGSPNKHDNRFGPPSDFDGLLYQCRVRDLVNISRRKFNIRETLKKRKCRIKFSRV